MRRLLALDTSTWWAGVALVEDGRVTLERRRHVTDSHAARLLPLIEAALADAGWERATIDAFAAVRGPGSFTGIRVGLGLLRGLALASGRACVGVGTLDAMAQDRGSAPGARVPVLDASRGEVFAAVFDPSGVPPAATREAWLGSPRSVVEAAPRGAVAFGPGAEKYAALLEAGGLAVEPGRAGCGVAGAAGIVAWRRLEAGARHGADVEPLYLRPADAELAR
ncbi:MAG TPA: tRNA (adenosine(37)-N6)-threonylcarbamoyltransferase complex dimerization subunit type 1 TsaB [Candidatus Polarisedimenticolaceae bacterium]